jgi:hypothetical protein
METLVKRRNKRSRKREKERLGLPHNLYLEGLISTPA